MGKASVEVPKGIYTRACARAYIYSITCIMYHYKVVNGDTVEYKSAPFPPSTTVTDMQTAIEKREKQRLFAAANWTQINVDDDEELPF